MASRRVAPRWQQRFTERLNALEERLRRGFSAEKEERQREEAATEEELHELQQKVTALCEEQEKWARRIRWIERQMKRTDHGRQT